MQENTDYSKLISEVVKKQISILGPDIALSKTRSIEGLVVSNDGTIISIDGDPQKKLEDLINQFIDLSGIIVKNTIDALIKNKTEKENTTLNPLPEAAKIGIENNETNVIPPFPQQDIQNVLDGVAVGPNQVTEPASIPNLISTPAESTPNLNAVEDKVSSTASLTGEPSPIATQPQIDQAQQAAPVITEETNSTTIA